MAVGIFNIGKDTPIEAFSWANDEQKLKITVGADQLGLTGIHKVRDLWRQQDIGTFEKTFGANVPHHGVVLLKLTPVE
jgi:alpha-galactosidase